MLPAAETRLNETNGWWCRDATIRHNPCHLLSHESLRKDSTFHVVVCSPYSRCVQTAVKICKQLGDCRGFGGLAWYCFGMKPSSLDLSLETAWKEEIWWESEIHPRKQTWNLKITCLERKIIWTKPPFLGAMWVFREVSHHKICCSILRALRSLDRSQCQDAYRPLVGRGLWPLSHGRGSVQLEGWDVSVQSRSSLWTSDNKWNTITSFQAWYTTSENVIHDIIINSSIYIYIRIYIYIGCIETEG